MKRNFIAFIALVGAFAVCGAGWVSLPVLEDPEHAVESQVAKHVEQARRALQRYDHGLAYKSLLLDQLEDLNVDVALEDPGAVADSLADDYQQRHKRAWEAYEPRDWSSAEPRPESARYGNPAQQIREGVNGRNAALDENAQWLRTAQSYVDKALAVSVGDVSSRTHAEAVRLKGIILYEMGVVEWIRSRMMRANAVPFRRKLSAIAAKAVGYAARQTLVEDSQAESQIQRLQAKAADKETDLAKHRQALAALEATLADLEAKLASAEARAEKAREEMRRLIDRGIDFTDPDGPQSFAAKLKKQDQRFRTAYRKVQALRHGTYPDATLDRAGDYLDGQYVENGSSTVLTVSYGLDYYRDERDALAAALEAERRGLDDLRADIARIEGMKRLYESEQQEAQDRMAEVAPTARDTYDELNRVESEAFAVEEDALSLFDRAERTLKQAAGFSKRDQPWMGGHMTAQAADARLAAASVQYQRFSAYSRDAELLAAVTRSVDLKEVDVQAERDKAAEAHEHGVEAIQSAMAELEKAHRAAGRHWTFVAQAGSANHLMALFGHRGYYNDAVEAYRSALKGREGEPYTEKLTVALKRLEER